MFATADTRTGVITNPVFNATAALVDADGDFSSVNPGIRAPTSGLKSAAPGSTYDALRGAHIHYASGAIVGVNYDTVEESEYDMFDTPPNTAIDGPCNSDIDTGYVAVDEAEYDLVDTPIATVDPSRASHTDPVTNYDTVEETEYDMVDTPPDTSGAMPVTYGTLTKGATWQSSDLYSTLGHEYEVFATPAAAYATTTVSGSLDVSGGGSDATLQTTATGSGSKVGTYSMLNKKEIATTDAGHGQA